MKQSYVTDIIHIINIIQKLKMDLGLQFSLINLSIPSNKIKCFKCEFLTASILGNVYFPLILQKDHG